jgi:Tfp pilus assembly protein PilO
MSLWQRIFQERRRVVVPLAIALVANIAVLLLAVLPLRTNVASLQEQSVNASLALAQARHLEKSAKDALASRERANTELQKFYEEILPRGLPDAMRINRSWLPGAAEAAGLRYTGGAGDQDELRDSRLTRATSKISLEGSYANIRKFLYSVETAEEFVVIERVELQQTGNDAPSTAPSGRLLVVMSVATYFLTPKQP